MSLNFIPVAQSLSLRDKNNALDKSTRRLLGVEPDRVPDPLSFPGVKNQATKGNAFYRPTPKPDKLFKDLYPSFQPGSLEATMELVDQASPGLSAEQRDKIKYRLQRLGSPGKVKPARGTATPVDIDQMDAVNVLLNLGNLTPDVEQSVREGAAGLKAGRKDALTAQMDELARMKPLEEDSAFWQSVGGQTAENLPFNKLPENNYISTLINNSGLIDKAKDAIIGKGMSKRMTDIRGEQIGDVLQKMLGRTPYQGMLDPLARIGTGITTGLPTLMAAGVPPVMEAMGRRNLETDPNSADYYQPYEFIAPTIAQKLAENVGTLPSKAALPMLGALFAGMGVTATNALSGGNAEKNFLQWAAERGGYDKAQDPGAPFISPAGLTPGVSQALGITTEKETGIPTWIQALGVAAGLSPMAVGIGRGIKGKMQAKSAAKNLPPDLMPTDRARLMVPTDQPYQYAPEEMASVGETPIDAFKKKNMFRLADSFEELAVGVSDKPPALPDVEQKALGTGGYSRAKYIPDDVKEYVGNAVYRYFDFDNAGWYGRQFDLQDAVRDAIASGRVTPLANLIGTKAANKVYGMRFAPGLMSQSGHVSSHGVFWALQDLAEDMHGDNLYNAKGLSGAEYENYPPKEGFTSDEELSEYLNKNQPKLYHATANDYEGNTNPTDYAGPGGMGVYTALNPDTTNNYGSRVKVFNTGVGNSGLKPTMRFAPKETEVDVRGLINQLSMKTIVGMSAEQQDAYHTLLSKITQLADDVDAGMSAGTIKDITTIIGDEMTRPSGYTFSPGYKQPNVIEAAPLFLKTLSDVTGVDAVAHVGQGGDGAVAVIINPDYMRSDQTLTRHGILADGKGIFATGDNVNIPHRMSGLVERLDVEGIRNLEGKHFSFGFDEETPLDIFRAKANEPPPEPVSVIPDLPEGEGPVDTPVSAMRADKGDESGLPQTALGIIHQIVDSNLKSWKDPNKTYIKKIIKDRVTEQITAGATFDEVKELTLGAMDALMDTTHPNHDAAISWVQSKLPKAVKMSKQAGAADPKTLQKVAALGLAMFAGGAYAWSHIRRAYEDAVSEEDRDMIRNVALTVALLTGVSFKGKTIAQNFKALDITQKRANSLSPKQVAAVVRNGFFSPDAIIQKIMPHVGKAVERARIDSDAITKQMHNEALDAAAKLPPGANKLVFKHSPHSEPLPDAVISMLDSGAPWDAVEVHPDFMKWVQGVDEENAKSPLWKLKNAPDTLTPEERGVVETVVRQFHDTGRKVFDEAGVGPNVNLSDADQLKTIRRGDRIFIEEDGADGYHATVLGGEVDAKGHTYIKVGVETSGAEKLIRVDNGAPGVKINRPSRLNLATDDPRQMRREVLEAINNGDFDETGMAKLLKLAMDKKDPSLWIELQNFAKSQIGKAYGNRLFDAAIMHPRIAEALPSWAYTYDLRRLQNQNANAVLAGELAKRLGGPRFKSIDAKLQELRITDGATRQNIVNLLQSIAGKDIAFASASPHEISALMGAKRNARVLSKIGYLWALGTSSIGPLQLSTFANAMSTFGIKAIPGLAKLLGGSAKALINPKSSKKVMRAITEHNSKAWNELDAQTQADLNALNVDFKASGLPTFKTVGELLNYVLEGGANGEYAHKVGAVNIDTVFEHMSEAWEANEAALKLGASKNAQSELAMNAVDETLSKAQMAQSAATGIGKYDTAGRVVSLMAAEAWLKSAPQRIASWLDKGKSTKNWKQMSPDQLADTLLRNPEGRMLVDDMRFTPQEIASLLRGELNVNGKVQLRALPETMQNAVGLYASKNQGLTSQPYMPQGLGKSPYMTLMAFLYKFQIKQTQFVMKAISEHLNGNPSRLIGLAAGAYFASYMMDGARTGMDYVWDEAVDAALKLSDLIGGGNKSLAEDYAEGRSQVKDEEAVQAEWENVFGRIMEASVAGMFGMPFAVKHEDGERVVETMNDQQLKLRQGVPPGVGVGFGIKQGVSDAATKGFDPAVTEEYGWFGGPLSELMRSHPQTRKAMKKVPSSAGK